jgi:hypothetical protein
MTAPLPAAASSRTDDAVAIPGFLLAFSLAAVVLALRAPDALTLPQFWAEDGVIFFAQQYDRALPPLFQPYAGYLLVVNRLVAWFATLFSNVHAPLIYDLAAVGIGAASIASLRRLPLPPAAFWVFLAAFALTPTNIEVFGTLTNTQWLLQFYLLLPMARFVSGEAPRRPVVACLLAAVVGLSGPFSAFAVAGAMAGLACRSLETRTRPSPRALLRNHPDMAVLLLCAIVQATLVLVLPDVQNLRASATPGWNATREVIAALQTHTLGYAWLPHAVFCGVSVLAVIGCIATARSAAARALVVAMACFVAVQLWTVASKHAAVPTAIPDLILDLGYADRYFLLFKVLFWVSLLLAVRGLSGRLRAIVLPLMLLAIGFVAVQNNDRLRRAPMADLDWKTHAQRMDRGEAVTAPINPQPWSVVVGPRKP